MSACLASPASAGLVQHHAEICAVAEQIHIKLMSLMLHQQRIPDALAQVESHISSFRHLPPGAQPASAAAHWSWARRQYTVAGELLGNRVSAETLPDRRSAQPAFFFQCAARAVAMERSAAMGCTPPSQPETEALLVQGPYVGQMWRPATEGGGGRAVTDDEYENFLASREAGTSFSQQVKALRQSISPTPFRRFHKGDAPKPLAPLLSSPLPSSIAMLCLLPCPAVNAPLPSLPRRCSLAMPAHSHHHSIPRNQCFASLPPFEPISSAQPASYMPSNSWPQRIEMLSRAYEGYKKYTAKKEGGGEVQRASRTIYHLAHQMAVEYLSEGEPSTARRLLDRFPALTLVAQRAFPSPVSSLYTASLTFPSEKVLAMM